MSRRIRSFLLCLAVGAILSFALPGLAAGADTATAPAVSTVGDTSAIPTHFAGGCESHLHGQRSSVFELQQHT